MKQLVHILFTSLLLPIAAVAQQWEYTGSMHHERRHHITQLLPTGEILVAGGTDNPQYALSSCEVYDPASGMWRNSNAMNVARERHTATMLPSGVLVVIGGNSGSTSGNVLVSAIEHYNPVTDTWKIEGYLNRARQNHSAVLLPNGKILVIGGYTGGVTSDCELYDPITGQTTSAASLNTPRHDLNAIGLSTGHVLAVGGRHNEYMTSCEIYDYLTNTWRVTGSMYQPRMVGSLVQLANGTILATGGRKSENEIAPGAEVFDPVTEQWTEIVSMDQARHWQGGVLMPGDRYLITGGYYGGNLQTNSIVDCTKICEWYDKANQRWYFAPQLNLQRAQHGAVYFTYQQGTKLRENVIVTGGIIEDYQITNTCEILDVTQSAIEYYMNNQQKLSVAEREVAPQLLRFVLDKGRSLLVVGEPGNLEICDLTGRVVYTVSVDSPSLYALGAFNLPPGLYIARLTGQSGSSIVKILN